MVVRIFATYHCPHVDQRWWSSTPTCKRNISNFMNIKDIKLFEQIKKNWQDWKDGAEDRKRASEIRKRAYKISKIREDRIWKEKKEKGIIHCRRCGYDHHKEATCEEAIADYNDLDLRDVVARNHKSIGQRAQQSFISSIIFGVWK